LSDSQNPRAAAIHKAGATCSSSAWPIFPYDPEKTPLVPNDLIKNVEKGIYIIGNGSYSIDQQRYNFQFSGQLFYEIKNGKIVGMLKDVAYQANTPGVLEFLRSHLRPERLPARRLLL